MEIFHFIVIKTLNKILLVDIWNTFKIIIKNGIIVLKYQAFKIIIKIYTKNYDIFKIKLYIQSKNTLKYFTSI